MKIVHLGSFFSLMKKLLQCICWHFNILAVQVKTFLR
uniref:Uncharacterized protein n=1 Tax=Anguilla anguilla TaxID=7936 RepID=A0A0E9RAK9_ANGAN